MVIARPPIVKLSASNTKRKFLIYGDSGIGKTPAAATLPSSILVSAEEGNEESALLSGATCDLWPVGSWKEYQEVEKYFNIANRKSPNTGKPYEWIILDTGTAIQEKLGLDIIKGGVKKGRLDPEVMGRPDHLIWQTKFKSLLGQLVALPYNVMLVCHAMSTETEDGDIEKLPFLAGGETWHKIAIQMCAKFNAVGYMEVISQEGSKKKTRPQRRIWWDRHPGFFAKGFGRVKGLPEFVEAEKIDFVNLFPNGRRPVRTTTRRAR